jgi:hypothetical protein
MLQRSSSRITARIFFSFLEKTRLCCGWHKKDFFLETNSSRAKKRKEKKKANGEEEEEANTTQSGNKTPLVGSYCYVFVEEEGEEEGRDGGGIFRVAPEVRRQVHTEAHNESKAETFLCVLYTAIGSKTDEKAPQQ